MVYYLTEAELALLYKILMTHGSPEACAAAYTKHLEPSLTGITTNLATYGQVNIFNQSNFITYAKYYDKPKVPAHVTIIHGNYFNQITTNPNRAFSYVMEARRTLPRPVQTGIFNSDGIDRFILPKTVDSDNLIKIHENYLSETQRATLQFYQLNKYKLGLMNEYISYIDKGTLTFDKLGKLVWVKIDENDLNLEYSYSNGEVSRLSEAINDLMEDSELKSENALKRDIFNQILAPRFDKVPVNNYVKNMRIINEYNKK